MKTKRRLLSILLTFLLIFSNIFIGGVTAKADPSDNSSENSAIITEQEENFTENEGDVSETEEVSTVEENVSNVEKNGSVPTDESAVSEGDPVQDDTEEISEETAPEINRDADGSDVPTETDNVPEEAEAEEGILSERASSGKCGDNVTWSFDDGTLTISGTGDMYDYDSSDPGYYDFRNEVYRLIIEDGITNIGKYAFYDFESINTVEIPDSVKTICDRAFDQCMWIESVVIGQGVTHIGVKAFNGCSELADVEFRGSAPTISSDAFTGVTAKVYYPTYSSYITGWTSDVMLNYGGNLTWKNNNQCGDKVTWYISSGTLYIQGEGPMWDFDDEDPRYLKQKDKIKSVYVSWTITRIGNYAFYDLDNITRTTIGDDVTEIGNDAFEKCSSLTSVTIPAGVTSIGGHAFAFCTSLEKIEFQGSAPAFGNNYVFANVTATATYLPVDGWSAAVLKDYGGTINWVCDNKVGNSVTWACSGGVLTLSGSGFTYDYTNAQYPSFWIQRENIKSIVVEEGVLSLGNYMFCGLYNATKITLPSSLQYINGYAFSFCRSLQKIDIPSGINKIAEGTFYHCLSLENVTLPPSVTVIGERAFYDCEALKEIVIPSGVKRIERYTFYNCPALEKITLPENLKYIGEYTFWGTGLTSITLPPGLEEIQTHAFGCPITEVSIPASVTAIADDAFAGCTKLKKFIVDKENKSFTSADGVLFSKQKTILLQYPIAKEDSSYSVPAGTETIQASAFANSINLVSVTIPGGVTVQQSAFIGSKKLASVTIKEGVVLDGGNIFSNCTVLKTVIFEEGLTIIPGFTFYHCDSLASITIPASVVEIESYAFCMLNNFKTITFKGAPPLMHYDSFEYTTGPVTGYYPESMVDLWKDAVKKNYGCEINWVARHIDVTGMKFMETTKEIPVGKTEALEVIFEPADAYATLTWKSSAPGVASVDDNGNVTAKKVGKTTISATAEIGGKDITIKCTVNVLFKDVTNKGYAPYTAIYALSAKNIVAGFSDGTFRPNDPVTRGQVLVFLWRSANKPEPKAKEITFKDAAEIKALGPQYEKAVLWGIEKGITEGFTDNTFRPNANCTRGQIVTFLWRYKNKPSPKAGYNGSFPDVPKSHTFYKAVSWAASYKITTGFSDGTFGPTKNCTRGQCVAFIYRMLNL